MAGISVVLLTGFETMATGVAAVFVAVQVFAAEFSLGALLAYKTGEFAGTGDVAATRPGVAAVLWMSASSQPFPRAGPTWAPGLPAHGQCQHPGLSTHLTGAGVGHLECTRPVP